MAKPNRYVRFDWCIALSAPFLIGFVGWFLMSVSPPPRDSLIDCSRKYAPRVVEPFGNGIWVGRNVPFEVTYALCPDGVVALAWSSDECETFYECGSVSTKNQSRLFQRVACSFDKPAKLCVTNLEDRSIELCGYISYYVKLVPLLKFVLIATGGLTFMIAMAAVWVWAIYRLIYACCPGPLPAPADLVKLTCV